jgi:hypothetical protein
MVRYTCDMCGKPIDLEADERFRVLIDVEQMHPGEDDSDLESDFSGEFDDMLHELEGGEAAREESLFRSFKFDLCLDCASTYLLDPLARKVPRRMRFMDN